MSLLSRFHYIFLRADNKAATLRMRSNIRVQGKYIKWGYTTLYVAFEVKEAWRADQSGGRSRRGERLKANGAEAAKRRAR